MNELFYGSIAEREALANAITNKGVNTSVADTLDTMAENVSNIDTVVYDSGSGTISLGDNGSSTITINFNKTFNNVPNFGLIGLSYIYETSNSITTTKATIGIRNQSNATRTANYKWIAYAKE